MLPDATSASSPLLPAFPVERRSAQRFAPRRVLIGQIEPDEGGRIPTRVQNLSARGVGLLADRPFPAGAVVKIRLVNAAAMFALLVTARVKHCNQVLTGDHYLGCEFEQALAPGEMRPFLV